MRRVTAGILLAALVLTSPAISIALAEEAVHAQNAAEEEKNIIRIL